MVLFTAVDFDLLDQILPLLRPQLQLRSHIREVVIFEKGKGGSVEPGGGGFQEYLGLSHHTAGRGG